MVGDDLAALVGGYVLGQIPPTGVGCDPDRPQRIEALFDLRSRRKEATIAQRVKDALVVTLGCSQLAQVFVPQLRIGVQSFSDRFGAGVKRRSETTLYPRAVISSRSCGVCSTVFPRRCGSMQRRKRSIPAWSPGT
ncbi:hypothetical protein [Dactylosporangium salmoneum]|uniref:Uncharacterized protein n=1 Tax=Dactylosporangium salmoneum TaxID=53361 RepID=A0ABN3HW09_9ACTN